VVTDRKAMALWHIIGWDYSQRDYRNKSTRKIDEVFESVFVHYLNKSGFLDFTPEEKKHAHNGFTDGWLDYRDFVGNIGAAIDNAVDAINF